MQLSDVLTLGGASIVVALLVQLLKEYIPERAVPVAAFVVGIVVVVAAGLALGHADANRLGTDVVTGILAGAAAIGWYSAQKPVGLLPPKE